MSEEEVIQIAKTILREQMKDLNITTVRKVCSQIPKQFQTVKDDMETEKKTSKILMSYTKVL